MLVYRSVINKWEGPHTFVSVDVDTAVIKNTRCRRIFISSCVVPYKNPEFHIDDDMLIGGDKKGKIEDGQFSNSSKR